MSRSSLSSKLRSGASLAWAHADRAVDTAIRYANCFGVARGPFLYILSSAWRPYQGRLVETAAAANGAKLLVRLKTSDINVFNGIYCWQEYDWEFQRSPRVIVDAGAYTGLSTVYFATRYPDAKVIAIEPSRSNFDLLVRNTAHYENVYPVHAALWSHAGPLTMSDPGSGAWGLQVRESAGSLGGGQPGLDVGSGLPVRAITIPDVIRDFDLERIDLLKLDIEGSEKEVFDDCRSWIGQVDAICMELHDRFKTGCSRSFFKAVDEFPAELWRGENVLVMRSGSPLDVT